MQKDIARWNRENRDSYSFVLDKTPFEDGAARLLSDFNGFRLRDRRNDTMDERLDGVRIRLVIMPPKKDER